MPSRSEIVFEVVTFRGESVYEGDLETCKFAADVWSVRERWSMPVVRVKRDRRAAGWSGGVPSFTEGRAGGVVYRA
jgi:hypothetical protein